VSGCLRHLIAVSPQQLQPVTASQPDLAGVPTGTQLGDRANVGDTLIALGLGAHDQADAPRQGSGSQRRGKPQVGIGQQSTGMRCQRPGELPFGQHRPGSAFRIISNRRVLAPEDEGRRVVDGEHGEEAVAVGAGGKAAQPSEIGGSHYLFPWLGWRCTLMASGLAIALTASSKSSRLTRWVIKLRMSSTMVGIVCAASG
jgi:hypothetical protein